MTGIKFRRRKVDGRMMVGDEPVLATAEELNRTADPTLMRAFLADAASAVVLAAQAYTTLDADLDNMLDVTTGATDATITLLGADAAGADAIQSIRKVDSGAGRVIIMSGGVAIAILVVQNEVAAMRSDGASWAPLIYRGRRGILATSAVSLVAPLDTVENILATIPIPAGLIGANGGVSIDTLWGCDNNANVKTGRARLGGIGGSIVASMTLTSSAGGRHLGRFQNRGAANSQVFPLSGSATGTSGTANGTATQDTALAKDLVITGQKATGADSLRLEWYKVTLE